MHDFTRRTLLQGGTALAAAGALTGPALFDFAKAWAQTAPWKAEPGAKLTVMRWKRFVPAEDDAFNAMVAAFKAATGTEMNVFSESFEDVQPKASVAANTGSGLDLAWGLHTLPQLFPTKVLKMNDVADYLGKKYGGWTDAAAKTCKQGNDWLGIPVATIGGYMTYRKSAMDKAGFKEFPKDFPGFLEMCKALKKNNTPAGFALGHATGDANGWLHWVLWGHGAYTVDKNDKVIINSPETAKALEYCKALSDTFIPGTASWNDGPTTRRSWPANSIAPPTASRSMLPRRTIRTRRISPTTPTTRCGRSVRSASRPNCSLRFRSWRSTSPNIRMPRRPSSPSCWRRNSSRSGCRARGGILPTRSTPTNSAPVWTADPKNQVFSQASKRALPASGIGTPGEKAATAIADFIVVDMFANYCTGTKDAKGAIADAERQLKRIYRSGTIGRAAARLRPPDDMS